MCIGARVPVQSRTCTGWSALDLVDVEHVVAVRETEPRVLAELTDELREARPRERDEAPLG